MLDWGTIGPAGTHPRRRIIDGMTNTQDRKRRIVVGVDGSEDSVAALRWAADEARAHGADLEVVHAWAIPFAGSDPMMVVPAVRFDLDELEASARRVIDRTIDEVDLTGIGSVERHAVRSGVTQAILDAAKGADMVVVGSRGLGGFGGLILGSVGHQLTHHATCPVVIVPHDR